LAHRISAERVPNSGVLAQTADDRFPSEPRKRCKTKKENAEGAYSVGRRTRAAKRANSEANQTESYDQAQNHLSPPLPRAIVLLSFYQCSGDARKPKLAHSDLVRRARTNKPKPTVGDADYCPDGPDLKTVAAHRGQGTDAAAVVAFDFTFRCG
jgi:hypothetical protein